MKKTMLLLFILLLSSALWAQQKFALVIGNGAYTGSPWGTLNNPINDANAMESALKSLGFTVEVVRNGTKEQMETAVFRLYQKLSSYRGQGYAFFYYAGHGAQHGGENYLIPVNAVTPSLEDLETKTLSVNFVLKMLTDSNNELNMIVLDACRDLPASLQPGKDRGDPIVRGIASVTVPRGSIVMYATAADSSAADGTGGNGLFTSHLLQNLTTPGIEVKEIFNRTGAGVSQATGGIQFPELRQMYYGTAYLNGQPSPTPNPPSPTPVPSNMVRIEGGTFMMGSPPNEYGRSDNEVMHRVTVSSFYMGKYPVTQKEWREVMGSTVRQQRDMTDPELGIYGEGDNYPMYYVSWYEAIEYCNSLSQREGLTPAYTIDSSRSDPNNRNEYDTVKWVVTRNPNANGYRLPTEAEWEYACRAGTTTAYNTGNNISDNTGWYGNNSGISTHPVGQKPANALGLYDMHGNVWEWCWDWYDEYKTGTQTDPAGAASGDIRVVRGGSWINVGRYLRSACRVSHVPELRVLRHWLPACAPLSSAELGDMPKPKRPERERRRGHGARWQSLWLLL